MDSKRVQKNFQDFVKSFSSFRKNTSASESLLHNVQSRHKGIPKQSSLREKSLGDLLSYREKMDFTIKNLGDFGSDFLPKLADLLQTSQSSILSALTDLASIHPTIGIVVAFLQSVVETVLHFNTQEAEFNRSFYNSIASAGQFTAKYGSGDIALHYNKMRDFTSSIGLGHSNFSAALEAYGKAGGIFNLSGDLEGFGKEFVENVISPAAVLRVYFNKSFEDVASVLGDLSFTLGKSVPPADLFALANTASSVGKKDAHFDSVIELVKAQSNMNVTLVETSEMLNTLTMTHTAAALGFKSLEQYLQLKNEPVKFSVLFSQALQTVKGRELAGEFLQDLEKMDTSDLGQIERKGLSSAIDVLRDILSGKSVDQGAAYILKDYIKMNNKYLDFISSGVSGINLVKNHYLVAEELFGLNLSQVKAVESTLKTRDLVAGRQVETQELIDRAKKLNLSQKTAADMFAEKFDYLKFKIIFPAVKGMLDSMRDFFYFVADSALINRTIPNFKGIISEKNLKMDEEEFSKSDSLSKRYVVESQAKLKKEDTFDKLIHLEYTTNKVHYDNEYNREKSLEEGVKSVQSSSGGPEEFLEAYTGLNLTMQHVAQLAHAEQTSDKKGFSVTNKVLDRN